MAVIIFEPLPFASCLVVMIYLMPDIVQYDKGL